jgi:hypothetical protein
MIQPNVIVNITQSCSRVSLRDDGLVPTLTTHCGSFLAPYFGSFLSSAQCLALQGVDPRTVRTDLLSETEACTMVGMGMSVPVIGLLQWFVVDQLKPE